MRLTKQSIYAVRTLMYCAVNDPKLSRVSEIAKAYSISELFLFKLIKPLVEGGMIQTLRGRNGGIRLARPADEIRLLDAIKLTEDFPLTECFEGAEKDLPLIVNSELSAALTCALDAFFDALDQYTIASLVENRVDIRSQLGLDADNHAQMSA